MGFCLFTGLKSREERSKQYFDTALDQDFSQGTDWEVDNIDQQFGLASAAASGHISQQQLLLLEEDNARMAARREHEVRQIVKSIVDLNDIFKDLAQMVADQVIIILYELHYIIPICAHVPIFFLIPLLYRLKIQRVNFCSFDFGTSKVSWLDFSRRNMKSSCPSAEECSAEIRFQNVHHYTHFHVIECQ